MKPRAQARDLTLIADEIRARIETVGDIIAIGGLLREAKIQFRHGGFLPWLKSEFDFSVRTAQNYMRAHRFATKNATVAHLKLTPTGLYALAEGYFSADYKYTADEVALVLEEATEKRVTGTRAVEIVEAEIERKNAAEYEKVARKLAEEGEGAEETTELVTVDTPELTEAKALAAAQAAEAAALLEAGSEVPPPESAPQSSPRKAAILTTFEGAIKALHSVKTKPMSEFKKTNFTAPELQIIVEFLQQVTAVKGAAAV
jgi:hypothetical protein